jgi:predicted DNA-binding protein (MmcQ/YjbR family)
MDIESLRTYCLAKKGVTEELPFGPDTLVFKVMGKMFALLPLENLDLRLSLKNTPDKNLELRAQHPGIQGAYHMNKKHWNMVLMSMGVPSKLLFELIDESYDLVVRGLTKKLREELEEM